MEYAVESWFLHCCNWGRPQIYISPQHTFHRSDLVYSVKITFLCCKTQRCRLESIFMKKWWKLKDETYRTQNHADIICHKTSGLNLSWQAYSICIHITKTISNVVGIVRRQDLKLPNNIRPPIACASFVSLTFLCCLLCLPQPVYKSFQYVHFN
jgi:hypothetical protein